MSVVVEFTIGAEQFQLGELFAGFDDIRIEVVDLVPIGTGPVPYLWIDGDETAIAAVEEALAAADRVADFVPVTDHAGRRLYRVEWAVPIDGLFACMTESDVAVDAAVGTGDTWQFRVFSAAHENITAFQRTLADHGLSITVQQLHRPAVPGDGPTVDLTPEQREALLAAFEAGYFEIPRQTTLDSLAAELDISRQALANRLQRAFTTLIETTVVGPPLE